MEMRKPSVYDLESAFKNMDEDKRQTEYLRVVEAWSDSVEILNAFVSVSKRLPNY